nr:YeeE/YedE family protein [Herbaspirillum rhizosphaerae]
MLLASRRGRVLRTPSIQKEIHMHIDWAGFTPWTSLAGGLLIGLAVALLILLNGRIAGISGILGGLLRPSKGEVFWRVAFIAGLLIAPLAYGLVASLPTVSIEAGTPTLIISGLLVGLGTRYGSGCTSGHGVCGLSRLSVRSLAATITFMAAGFVTVFVVRHLLG